MLSFKLDYYCDCSVFYETFFLPFLLYYNFLVVCHTPCFCCYLKFFQIHTYTIIISPSIHYTFLSHLVLFCLLDFFKLYFKPRFKLFIHHTICFSFIKVSQFENDFIAFLKTITSKFSTCVETLIKRYKHDETTQHSR